MCPRTCWVVTIWKMHMSFSCAVHYENVLITPIICFNNVKVTSDYPNSLHLMPWCLHFTCFQCIFNVMIQIRLFHSCLSKENKMLLRNTINMRTNEGITMMHIFTLQSLTQYIVTVFIQYPILCHTMASSQLCGIN